MIRLSFARHGTRLILTSREAYACFDATGLATDIGEALADKARLDILRGWMRCHATTAHTHLRTREELLALVGPGARPRPRQGQMPAQR